MEGPAGEIGTIDDVAAAAVAGNLHVVVTTGTGGVYHTIRFPSGGWTLFGNVEAVLGDAGVATDVGVAGRENGQVHVLIALNDGRLLHTMRFANGSWQGYINAESRAGEIGSPREVTAA